MNRRRGARDYVPALGIAALTPWFDALVSLAGFGRRRREQVTGLLAPRTGEVVLDVGCGTGTQLAAALRRQPLARGVGVDIDPTVLRLARRKLAAAGVRVGLVNASAAALPLLPQSTDAVVSTLVFHHLPTEVKRRALAEIGRVLRPGGRFLLVDLGRASGWLMRLYVRAVALVGIEDSDSLRDNAGGRIPAMLDAAGFAARPVAPRSWGIEFLLSTHRSAQGEDR